ncbi:DUF4352 domain-containing protein [Actinomycetaceae bacterium L2_0104]
MTYPPSPAPSSAMSGAPTPGPTQGASYPGAPMPPAKKPFYKRRWFIAVVVLLVFGGVGSAIDGSDSKPTGAPAADSTPAPRSAQSDDEAPVAEQAAEQGTRTNPFPVGTVITDGDWQLTVNGVNLDADELVSAENMFNEPAPEGQKYILVNITLTYNGDNPEGEIPMDTIEYVTAEGNTINSFDTLAVAPEAFDSLTTLYQGASTTGNVVFAVPADSADFGTLAIRVSMFGDKVFNAVS